MKKIIMTDPSGVVSPNIFKLAQEWSEVRNALVQAGADVIVMPTPSDMETSLFAANYGLLYGDSFIARTTKRAELHTENFNIMQWMSAHKIDTKYGVFDSSVNPKAMTFMGSQDALFSHDRKHLWFGFGFNSTHSYKAKLDEFFDLTDIIVRPVLLTDPEFSTLDSCFCPLDTGELLWYPEAFDPHSRMIIESWYDDKMIVMTRDDALRGVAYAISVDDSIITTYMSASLSTSLKSRGYTAIEVECEVCKSLTIEVIE